jgi:glutathione peroxidase-family protein
MFKILMVFMFSLSVYAQFANLKEKDINGSDFSFASLKGKKVIVVNIASQCGYTDQLEGLQKLYTGLKDKGFVVLGVPTNDFGGQTPEDDKGMKEFCQKKYAVTFPLLSKATILGKDKRPLYKWLTEQSPKDFQGDVKWNFEKFIIDEQGLVKARFRSGTSPEELQEELKKIFKI